jgi:hypothetical protein
MRTTARRLAGWLTGDHLTIVAVVAGVLGIALVALAQRDAFDWTRIIGALLVSASGIGFGVRFGFAEPLRWRWVGWLAAWRALAASFIVMLLVAPVAVGLLVLLAGEVDAAGEQPAWLLALGGLLAGVLLLGVLVSGWMATRSVLGAGGSAVTNAHPALADEDAGP